MCPTTRPSQPVKHRIRVARDRRMTKHAASRLAQQATLSLH
jgi:hypothetical protein